MFSGKITDFRARRPPAAWPPAPSPSIAADGSGTSFLLINHFAAVCTASNSNFVFPINVSTTYANAFAGGVVPSNFSGQSGSQALATFLSTAPSATGYLSPDFTTIDPKSGAVLSDGSKSNWSWPRC